MGLKAFFKRFGASDKSLVITREVMEVMAKTGGLSGPWRQKGSFRDHARRFLARYPDGNLRAKGEVPAMTVRELQVMAQISELW